MIETCKDKEKKIKTTIDLIKSDLDKNFQKILATLDEKSMLSSNKAPVFFWSEEFKGHKIKINGAIA